MPKKMSAKKMPGMDRKYAAEMQRMRKSMGMGGMMDQMPKKMKKR